MCRRDSIGVDSDTGLTFAAQVRQKGAKDAYAVAGFARFLSNLGAARLTIQTDGEPGIVDLARAVQRKATVEVITRISPKGSHASNGGAGRAVQTIKGITRVLCEQIRERVHIQASPRVAAFPPGAGGREGTPT